MGNMKLLAKNSSLWKEMEDSLVQNGEYGPAIPLRCDNHHQVTVMVIISITASFTWIKNSISLLYR